MICVHAVAVKNSRNVMERIFDFTEAINNIVIEPSVWSAFILLIAALINDLFAILPINVILSGQLLFLKEPPTPELFISLFTYVALPVSVGGTVGSLLTYTLAYFGGKPAIQKLGIYLNLSWERVEKIEEKFKGAWYDEVVFLSLRAIPFLPSLPINIAAGVIRMNPTSYVALTFIGTIIKTMVTFLLVALGIVALAQ